MKNKITVYLLVALAFISLESFSQIQFALGVKGGPNFAKIDASQSIGENYKNRTGFHAGAFMLFKVTKIGIQPEIIFSRQGSKYTFDTKNLESNYDYINIPIIVKLYLVAGLNLQVGPQFGFLSKGQVEAVVNNVSTSLDAKDLYNGADVSAALGAGWDLPFGLTIDARYNLGIKKNESLNVAVAPDYKNQVMQVSLGYKFIKIGK